MNSGTNYFQAHGARLIDNGYRIVPIMPGTKAPGEWNGERWKPMTGWRRPATEFDIGLWQQWPDAGVGIVTGHVIGIDIDLLDEEASHACREIFLKMLGHTSVIRVGRMPKVLLVYRTKTPFRKIAMKPLEVLAEGQQFVAYATHPDTGKPYYWPLDSVLDVPVEDLPEVTEEQVRAAMRAAYESIPGELKPLRLLVDGTEPRVETVSEGLLKGTIEAVTDAMQHIENFDLSWDDWNRVGMALYAATDGDAFELWQQFSARSAKYDPKTTAARWASYRRSPPRQIGAGTIYKIAMDHGWRPAADIPFNELKRSDNVDFTDLLEKVVAAPVPPKEESVEKRIAIAADKRAAFPHQWFETKSLVGEITRYMLASSLHPHPTFSLMNTLCMLGAVYGRRYRAATTDTRCMVASSARAHKETCQCLRDTPCSRTPTGCQYHGLWL